MKDALGVDPKTVIKQITLVRCGMGSNIELFSYQSPDQKVVQPKNSDIGGYHIAFYVDDIKAAADYLRAKNVKTMMGPFRSPRARPRDRRSSISMRRGGSSWRRSPIRRAWLTRRTRRRFFGRRRTRPSKALYIYSTIQYVLGDLPSCWPGRSAFGFSWLAAFSLRKPRLLTLGFVWISLDSLVESSLINGLHGIFAGNIFAALFPRRSQSGDEPSVLEGEGADCSWRKSSRFLIFCNIFRSFSPAVWSVSMRGAPSTF